MATDLQPPQPSQADPPDHRSLRHRLVGGAQAQVISNLSLVVIQLGTVSVVLPIWGIRLYGAWLILSAVPTYLALSELGLFSAASSDMTMSVARREHDHARDVFQAVSRGVAFFFGILLLTLPFLVTVAPLGAWLNLRGIDHFTVGAVVTLLALRTVLITYAGLLYGGFASAGHYGEGVMYMTAATFVEFVALVTIAAAGFGLGVAAAAMLASRVAATCLMYVAMRRRAPWLWFGKPAGKPQVLKRLLRPGLASVAIGSGAVINVQGVLLLVGIVLGPASAAIFVTVRTLSRVVIQGLSSIVETVAPELARAYGENDHALLRKLNRRASQTALWIAVPLIAGLAIFGSTIIHVWTRGRVDSGGWLLYLFLIGAGVDVVWFTTGGILFWTNRHLRVARTYIVCSFALLPLAYVMLEAWGLNGAAGALIVLEVAMLFIVLRQSLPAAHDTLGGWAAAILRPPGWALAALRSHLAGLRGS